MSPLPQRKKTAEELAQLRETLGVPTPPSADSSPAPSSAAQPEVDPEPVRPASPPKPVRSLRKSEREPVSSSPRSSAPRAAKAAGSLPARRHSDRDLNEMRLQQAFATRPPIGHLQSLAAHPAVLGFGYLLTAASALCAWRLQDYWPTAAAAGGALVLAVYIFIRKVRSRHHAGFIAVLVLFILAFAALYHFPQLRHAT